METTSPAPLSDDLRQAFEDLSRAQVEEDAEQKMQLLVDALGTLSPAQRARILAQPQVQRIVDETARLASSTGVLKPGSELRDRHGRLIGKVPWTVETMKQDAEARGDMVTWTPGRDQFLSVNGVAVMARAGQPITTPGVFKAVFEESLQADLNFRREAERIMHSQFGDYGVVIELD